MVYTAPEPDKPETKNEAAALAPAQMASGGPASGADDAGWGNPAAGENDGWGNPGAGVAGEDEDPAAAANASGVDESWGNPAPTANAAGADEGWATGAAGEAPRDGAPVVVTSYKRPARSGGQSAPTRPVDPIRKRFNEEIFTLVQSVRETLTRYSKGDHLSEEDELEIMDNVLVHHPNYEAKVGGVDYLKAIVTKFWWIAYSEAFFFGMQIDEPDSFPGLLCFFVVRKDGSAEDFSYHKCLKHLVQQSFGAEYSRLYDNLFKKKGRD